MDPSATRPLRALVAAVLVAALGCGDGNGGRELRIDAVAGGLGIGDRAAATATFLDPQDVAVDVHGNVFVVDANEVAGRSLVRRIDARTGTITTVGGPCAPLTSDDPELERARPERLCDLFAVGTITTHNGIDLFVSSGDDQIFQVDARQGGLSLLAGRPDECTTTTDDETAPFDACLGFVNGLALDRIGNLYLAESRLIRRLDADRARLAVVGGAITFPGFCHETPNAVGELLATDACLAPTGLAIDPHGDPVVATGPRDAVRRIDLASGLITTLAGTPGSCQGDRGDGGPAASACFASPTGIATAEDGTTFVADRDRIRRIDGTDATITTVVERDGTVERLATAPDGTVVFTEHTSGRGRVSRLDVASGAVTPVGGNATFSVCGEGGDAADACLGLPYGIALGADGTIDFVDQDNYRVGRIDPAGRVTTLAGGTRGFCGDGGPALEACFRNLTDVAHDLAGNLYVADRGDDDQGGDSDIVGRVRRIDAATGIVTTIAGNCTQVGSSNAAAACLFRPSALLFDASGGLLVGSQDGVQRIDLASGTIRNVVGGRHLAVDCSADGIAALDACVGANDLALDAEGDLFILDNVGSRVRRIDAASGTITTVAGNGVLDDGLEDDVPATSTGLFPFAIAIDAKDRLIVATAGVLRVVDLATGLIHTVPGSPRDCITSASRASANRCLFPNDIELDGDGRLMLAEPDGRRIRRVTLP